MRAKWAIGLMTGTVLDGMIDIAAVRTDGVEVLEFGPWTLAPYPADVRALLADAVARALAWQFQGPDPEIFAEAERRLSRAQADAVARFLADNGIAADEVAAIGFHGQTVLHRAPVPGRVGDTRQLADGQLMADQLGIDVVYDFRTADVRAGGQGAPLSASYHVALLRGLPTGPKVAVLNLGGVGNITWWDGRDRFVAFDTGPANGPINDWIRRHGAGEMDRDGAMAKSGRVDEPRLARLLAHPYLTAPYPKSLDRYDFTADMAAGLGLADGAATLTAFTAGAVGRGLDLLPVRPARLIVCGGGRKNPAIMAALAERARVEVVPAEAVGWRGDAVEAECFAYLAARVLAGLPISFPLTTGVPRPLTGGRVARHARG
ncbi:MULTISPECIES: anhydro-N-acetylmuramic acid kinase [Nitrospirillum]|uniref:Anhydro-N-acetylmuramic acid kinase n=1 Tax=Nitrospirillum amazonense TaxID=28077 RepID=A0A560FN91_9PROT|nr:anhydro-N-acetylmuramic acid kinase [Nitrospirillum amazonense]MEC4594938.1 anhydro-N-acetylmuramic acid kinase [Nitrospirillum amazonense]TWB23087.1 anhydro-N-acetylmuramic acid kinase [Nitrospirillum amazonense]